MIANLILGKKDKMPTSSIKNALASLWSDFFLCGHRVTSSTSTIGFDTNNRLEWCLSFCIDFIAIVEQLFNAVHIAMVCNSNRVHSGCDTLIHYLLNLCHTVQEGVVRVHM